MRVARLRLPEYRLSRLFELLHELHVRSLQVSTRRRRAKGVLCDLLRLFSDFIGGLSIQDRSDRVILFCLDVFRLLFVTGLLISLVDFRARFHPFGRVLEKLNILFCLVGLWHGSLSWSLPLLRH